MTYPLKFRQKAFTVKEKYSLTFEQASERFEVPIRTLFRWSKQLEPRTTRNKPATKVPMDLLVKDVDKYPDAYLWERAKRFNVGIGTIFYALTRIFHSNIFTNYLNKFLCSKVVNCSKRPAFRLKYERFSSCRHNFPKPPLVCKRTINP